MHPTARRSKKPSASDDVAVLHPENDVTTLVEALGTDPAHAESVLAAASGDVEEALAAHSFLQSLYDTPMPTASVHSALADGTPPPATAVQDALVDSFIAALWQGGSVMFCRVPRVSSMQLGSAAEAAYLDLQQSFNLHLGSVRR